MTRRLFRSFLSLSVEGRCYYEFTETTGYASGPFDFLRVSSSLFECPRSHLTQFCPLRSSSFFAVFWKLLPSRVASLPAKFVVGILFACRARSSHRQPYRQSLFDSRYGNGRGAIFSAIETFVELAWSAVARMERGSRKTGSRIPCQADDRTSWKKNASTDWRDGGSLYANAQNQYWIRVIGRVRSRLPGNYS